MDAKLHDEAGRIAALRRYEVLDTPPEAPFERIVNLVRAVLNVPISTVSLVDAERQWFKACVGLAESQTPRSESICTHTIRSREPLVVPDLLLDERFCNLPAVTGEPFLRTYAGAPLTSPDGYNLGSLCAMDTVPRHFEPAQIEVLKSFAALVVEELELRRVAQIDTLTEAATRRSLIVEMEKAVAVFQRTGRPATLLMLDVDHFKKVNDTYGHGAGDQVLRTLCARLTPMLRKEDILGRLGGEEFGILLNGSDADHALHAAERLRQAVEALRFTTPVPFQVTASFGLACLEACCTDVATWMERADGALYAAKRGGRNRTCVTESATPAGITPAVAAMPLAVCA